jgi:hypothetical protein
LLATSNPANQTAWRRCRDSQYCPAVPAGNPALAHDADQNRNGFVSCGCNCAVTLCNPIELRVAVSVIHLANVMNDKAIPKCSADIAGWTIPTLSGVASPVTSCCSAAALGSGWGAQGYYMLRIEAILHVPSTWGLLRLSPFSDLQNL